MKELIVEPRKPPREAEIDGSLMIECYSKRMMIFQRKNRDISGNSIITRIAIYMIEQDCQLLLSGQTVGNCPCFIGGYDMVLNQTIFYATIE